MPESPATSPTPPDPYLRLSEARAVAALTIAAGFEAWKFLRAHPDLVDQLVTGLKSGRD
jgi:hypothetical protein